MKKPKRVRLSGGATPCPIDGGFIVLCGRFEVEALATWLGHNGIELTTVSKARKTDGREQLAGGEG